VEAGQGIISSYGGLIERARVNSGSYGVLAYRNQTTVRSSQI
jgi:hypothetical protein